MNIDRNNIHEPLVSIVVITYNSSKYIVELLDSIYQQSYKNIELIISDDASTDNTVDICNEWGKGKLSRFINIDIITTKTNTGIAPNCNRGVISAKGVWIKLIAGDDILYDSAITDNISFIINNQYSPQIIFSKLVKFKYNINNTMPEDKQNTNFYNLNSREQLISLLDLSNTKADLKSPSLFIKHQTLKKLDYFDEKFPFIEDFPFLCKATSRGIKLHYFDRATVYYRMEESIQRDNSKYINEKYHESRKLFFILEKQKYYNTSLEHKISLIKQKYEIMSRDIIINYLGNKNGILIKIWLRINNYLLNKKIQELLK